MRPIDYPVPLIITRFPHQIRGIILPPTSPLFPASVVISTSVAIWKPLRPVLPYREAVAPGLLFVSRVCLRRETALGLSAPLSMISLWICAYVRGGNEWSDEENIIFRTIYLFFLQSYLAGP
mgnify:CR=1 FL=1